MVQALFPEGGKSVGLTFYVSTSMLGNRPPRRKLHLHVGAGPAPALYRLHGALDAVHFHRRAALRLSPLAAGECTRPPVAEESHPHAGPGDGVRHFSRNLRFHRHPDRQHGGGAGQGTKREVTRNDRQPEKSNSRSPTGSQQSQSPDCRQDPERSGRAFRRPHLLAGRGGREVRNRGQRRNLHRHHSDSGLFLSQGRSRDPATHAGPGPGRASPRVCWTT